MSTFVSLLSQLKGQHISEVIRAPSNAFAHEFPFFSQISQLPYLFTVSHTGTSSSSSVGLYLAVGLAPLEKKFCKALLFYTLERKQINTSVGAWSLVFHVLRGEEITLKILHCMVPALEGNVAYKNSPKELH